MEFFRSDDLFTLSDRDKLLADLHSFVPISLLTPAPLDSACDISHFFSLMVIYLHSIKPRRDWTVHCI